MILAGDIGGTKTNLALFESQFGTLRCVFEHRYSSQKYARLEEILCEFLRDARGTGGSRAAPVVSSAAFGVAGPVVDQRVRATNLPWIVDSRAIASELGIRRVILLNDLEATAHSLEVLQSAEILTLNEGTPAAHANKALIAAGTGLGEAMLIWNGSRHIISPTEGGHTDFAPRTDKEIELLQFLKRAGEPTEWETVLAGRGFRRIHEFLDGSVRHPSFELPGGDPAPEISRLGLGGQCPVCVETLDLWVEMYGAAAGNLALFALARAGLYVAGGIAVKNLPKMKDGLFVEAFCDKPKFRGFLEQIPIYMILNEQAPLLGAAAQATRLGA